MIWQQSVEMARRSILQTLRQPAMVVPPVLFPLVLMGINVGGLDAATNIPGFPTDSYLDFAIAFPFIQGLLAGSMAAIAISWQAHLGGLVTGAAVGFVYARTRARRQRNVQIWLLVAVTAVLVALLIIPAVAYV